MDYEKKDYKKLYKDIVTSDWFKRAYFNKSLGECPFDIPELRESEDERIRKLLVWQVYRNIEDETNDLAQSVYDGIKGHDPDLEESIEDWKKCLAYLEKQKEQKPVTIVRIPKFRVGDIIQHIPLEKWDSTKKITYIDEHGYNYNLSHLGDTVSGGAIGFAFEDEYELVEQKPAEWSKEDEKLFAFLHTCVCRCINDDRFDYAEREQISRSLIPFIERLKSIRPPKGWKEGWCDDCKVRYNHWKPSDEQMEALFTASTVGAPTYRNSLKSLYNDLKKLM